MLKKYRLKKEFPGSLSVGTIVEFYKNWDMYGVNSEAKYTKHIVEDYPEFWEEIKQSYEILSFINLSTNDIYKLVENTETYKKDNETTSYSLAILLDNKSYAIYSITRLNDGEVFTIGDALIDVCNKDFGDFTLMKIEFESAPAHKGTGKLSFIHNHPILGKWINLSSLQKVEQRFFITDDGVKIYRGSEYWYVITFQNSFTNNWIPERWVYEWNDNDLQPVLGNKQFSTKEKAWDYISMNKPCFSINDVYKLKDIPYSKWINYLKEVAKSRL
jgi:hypothetical protein